MGCWRVQRADVVFEHATGNLGNIVGRDLDAIFLPAPAPKLLPTPTSIRPSVTRISTTQILAYSALSSRKPAPA